MSAGNLQDPQARFRGSGRQIQARLAFAQGFFRAPAGERTGKYLRDKPHALNQVHRPDPFLTHRHQRAGPKGSPPVYHRNGKKRFHAPGQTKAPLGFGLRRQVFQPVDHHQFTLTQLRQVPRQLIRRKGVGRRFDAFPMIFKCAPQQSPVF